jgi:hypothetical protein
VTGQRIIRRKQKKREKTCLREKHSLPHSFLKTQTEAARTLVWR